LSAEAERIDDVEILRTGTHTASNGNQVTFTAEDLERFAAAVAPPRGGMD
jgi:hypothetical protein